MSELDPRQEAASIAHAAKRLIERERARGTGELLAAGVAKARANTARRMPARAQEPSPVVAAVAKPVAPESVAEIAAAPAAPAAPAASTMPDFISNSPAFKEPAPKAPPEYVLPPFTEPLNPRANTDARAAIALASLPVLAEVAAQARACTQCDLCKTRIQAVPGIGSARSGIVFVGEAPGADEDERGEPFVGRAGELLTRMIAGMNERQLIPGVTLDREQVYIVNVLKCRPPDNRNPLPPEIEACSPYVLRQLEALQPRVICCLGKFAADLLMGLKGGTISSMRGKTYRWKGAKLIVTYHPAYCLRSPSAKRPVWDDLQRLAQEYLSD